MGRRRKGEPPQYRLHAGKGLAYVRDGGRMIYLGAYGSAASHRAYRDFVRRWELENVTPTVPPAGPVTVRELANAFLEFAYRHYRRDDGSHTDEYDDYDYLVRAYLSHHFDSPANDFRPADLKAIRQRMVAADLSLGVINQRVGRVRRLFRWAVVEELVEPSVLAGLEAVPDLQPGRRQARETAPVAAVPASAVLRTIPFLPSRQLRAVVRLLLLTGMHPDEALSATTGRIARGGAVIVQGRTISLPDGIWAYVPEQHKGRWRGKPQVYLLGPKARKLLTPWLRDDPDAYLFQPREAAAELSAAKRAARKSGVPPSQRDRRRPHPKRRPGDRYLVTSLAHAVQKALEKANEARRGKGLQELPTWNPAQIRHTVASAVDARYGLEASGHVLGHQRMDTTLIYVERNLQNAARIMGEIG